MSASNKTRTFFRAVYTLLILGSGTVLYVISYCVTICPITPVTHYGLTPFKIHQVDRTGKAVDATPYHVINVLPAYVQPITKDTRWVRDLHDVVEQLAGGQITLLVSDRNYLDLLINWLAFSVLHAHYPAKSILIISFDNFTHSVLRNKGFQSVHIPPHCIIRSNNSTSKFAHIWVTRLAVMRLLNYWGYNVLLFDSDAVMLKNIQPLMDRFNSSDIISSPGTYPFNIHRKWAAPTLCMGVFLIKSSPSTELFWYMMKLVHAKTDDQVRVNMALDNMRIRWKLLKYKEGRYHEGIASGPTPLRVTTLSTSMICRYCKERLIGSYYVWHHHAVRVGTVKKGQLATTGYWILQDNWNMTIWNNVIGKQWLLSITSKPKYSL